ncbi:hypothetical protein Saa2_05354 [Streptomyces acidiscabies]|nr:hypothetical protein Saa2_05354 [Streptomyces acidiscabies]
MPCGPAALRPCGPAALRPCGPAALRPCSVGSCSTLRGRVSISWPAPAPAPAPAVRCLPPASQLRNPRPSARAPHRHCPTVGGGGRRRGTRHRPPRGGDSPCRPRPDQRLAHGRRRPASRGPYPATASTSVSGTAIERWMRPVVHQTTPTVPGTCHPECLDACTGDCRSQAPVTSSALPPAPPRPGDASPHHSPSSTPFSRASFNGVTCPAPGSCHASRSSPIQSPTGFTPPSVPLGGRSVASSS